MTETETTARPPATIGQTAGIAEAALASDIDTTIRILQAVAERARQLPPADQNGETR
jgi:hypothetical protein